MSDQDSNIFEEPQVTPDDKKAGGNSNTGDVQDSNPFADLLGTIKNERGEPKYRDPQTAFEALKHSQEFIPQLKNENSSLREKVLELEGMVTKLKTVEETVERLAASQGRGGETTSLAIDEQSIAELMERTLTKRDQEVRQRTNISQVTAKLKEKFGENAEATFYNKADELGMDRSEINSLAAKSPQAVLQLFGMMGEPGRQVNAPAPSKEGVNTAGFQPQQDTLVARNKKTLSVGATTQEYNEEHQLAKKMVEELHAQGLSVYDLTDPKKFFQVFK